MRIQAMVLVALLPLGGCDIFLDDEGGEGMPCSEPNDCQKGFVCATDHLCHKTSEETAFGTECQPGIPDACKGDFGVCACFPGHCYCTRPCGDPHACDGIGIVGSSARCTLMDPLGLEGLCADWQWTGGYGNWCIPGDTECENELLCVTFPVDGLHVCTTTCGGGCPTEYACEPAVDPAEGVCGIGHWFGFWHNCGSNIECENQYPSFTVCRNNQNCTRLCDSPEQCPPMSHCDNPPSGHCVPDI